MMTMPKMRSSCTIFRCTIFQRHRLWFILGSILGNNIESLFCYFIYLLHYLLGMSILFSNTYDEGTRRNVYPSITQEELFIYLC